MPRSAVIVGGSKCRPLRGPPVPTELHAERCSEGGGDGRRRGETGEEGYVGKRGGGGGEERGRVKREGEMGV